MPLGNPYEIHWMGPEVPNEEDNPLIDGNGNCVVCGRPDNIVCRAFATAPLSVNLTPEISDPLIGGAS